MNVESLDTAPTPPQPGTQPPLSFTKAIVKYLIPDAVEIAGRSFCVTPPLVPVRLMS